jgi:hypothetical protein
MKVAVVYLPCKDCGVSNEIPEFILVGRYSQYYHWWCRECLAENKYGKYFGCRNMEEALMRKFNIV